MEEGINMDNLNLDQRVEKSSGGGQAAMADFQLVSPAELARMLGVPPVTIYSWKRRGKIPYIQLERCIRFDLSEIKDWLEKRKHGLGECESQSLH
jgi:excisionase family DNA binding protein